MAEDKYTQKITLDDLAGMIQRNFLTVFSKEDGDRMETNLAREPVKIQGMIEELPTRVAEKIIDFKNLSDRYERLNQRVEALERKL